MWRYRDSASRTEIFIRAQRHVGVWLRKLAEAEYEYQIEKAKRIASGAKKATNSEAYKKKVIGYCVQQCRAIEKIHNRVSDINLNEFEPAVMNEPEYVVAKEILAKYKQNLKATQQYKTGLREYKRKQFEADVAEHSDSFAEVHPDTKKFADEIWAAKEKLKAEAEAAEAKKQSQDIYEFMKKDLVTTKKEGEQ